MHYTWFFLLGVNALTLCECQFRVVVGYSFVVDEPSEGHQHDELRAHHAVQVLLLRSVLLAVFVVHLLDLAEIRVNLKL